jgi:hypothetical protein
MQILTDFLQDARQLSEFGGIDNIQISSPVSDADLSALRQLSLEEIHLNCFLLSLLGWTIKESQKLAKDCIVQCNFCSRNIGLWAFTKDQTNCRTMDVVKEHKSYCPYVNGKTQGGLLQEDGQHTNAWQQRLQILIGSNSRDKGPALVLSQDQVRKMRSSDVLAKVKSIMM